MTKECSVVCTAKPLTVANVRGLQICCYLNRISLANMQLSTFALVNVLSVLKLRDYGDSGLYGISDVECVWSIDLVWVVHNKRSDPWCNMVRSKYLVRRDQFIRQ
jgi:hypothetical protein